jgi:hypothetical protein
MNTKLTSPLGGYRLSPALSLRDACQKTGHDDGARRCPACPLKGLCENEKRWSLNWSPDLG